MSDAAVSPGELSALLVEDSEGDALLILRALRNAGFTVRHRRVETATDMRASLGSGSWDVVLCDFNLPHFNAHDALDELHASGLDLPFIVVSGTIGDETAIALMRNGAHDYLMKDNLARLGPAVQRELGEARLRAERRRALDDLRESEATLREATVALSAANQRLRQLSGRILETQESERRELARELHDQIGQALTAVKLELQGMTSHLEEGPAVMRLASAIHITEEALAQVRGLSLNLRPPQLDYMGLEASLRWHAERTCERAGLALTFSTDLSGCCIDDARRAIVCFRLMQEALTNVVRHADAHTVRIDVTTRNGGLVLLIEDDGCGFDVETARRRMLEGASVGLLGMEERAGLLGGSVQFDSTPGYGTRVCVTLPCFEEHGLE